MRSAWPHVTVAFALALIGSGAAAEDLLQVYREALANDPALAAARANWEATQERVPQARAGLLPDVSLSANANANYFGTNIESNPRVRLKLREGIGARWYTGTAHLLPQYYPRERQRWLAG